MEDLEIFKFKNDLINHINAVNLPIVVKKMVVSEILNEISTKCKEKLRFDFEILKKQNEKKEEQDG